MLSRHCIPLLLLALPAFASPGGISLLFDMGTEQSPLEEGYPEALPEVDDRQGGLYYYGQ